MVCTFPAIRDHTEIPHIGTQTGVSSCQTIPMVVLSTVPAISLPWQIKSTLIILVFLPVRARSAAICRTLRWALREHILPKNRAKIRKCGKSRQIEDVIRSKNVVEIGVFYYWLPFVTLSNLGCRGLEAGRHTGICMFVSRFY